MPRRKHDFYETPPHYLEALQEYIGIEADQSVFEPCVGEGMIADWLLGPMGVDKVHTNDLDWDRKANYHFDAANVGNWDTFDWGVTNPPFDKINEITSAGLVSCTNYVTLARLSFLEPTIDRRELFKQYPPDMLIVLPRYSFRLNDDGKPATDSVTCAWIGWGPDVPQITTVWTKEPK